VGTRGGLEVCIEPQSEAGIRCWLGKERQEMGWGPPLRPDFLVSAKNDILMLLVL
jgi:hypothetical protein